MLQATSANKSKESNETRQKQLSSTPKRVFLFNFAIITDHDHRRVNVHEICACLKTGYRKNMRNGATANRLPIIFHAQPDSMNVFGCPIGYPHWTSPTPKSRQTIQQMPPPQHSPLQTPPGASSHIDSHMASIDHHPLMTPSFRAL